MNRSEYRIEMSREEFNSLVGSSEDRLYTFYEKLCVENANFTELDVDGIRNELTRGLRMLIAVTIFDSQVCNGGVTQFFWNSPGSIVDVCEAFEILDQTELHEDFEIACENVFGKKDKWLQLREEAYRDEANPDWRSFVETYELLDLRWFDEKYWDEFDTSKTGFEISRHGLRSGLNKAMEDYVIARPQEFVRFKD